MRKFLLKSIVIGMILGIANMVTAEPRIRGEAVEYSDQGVVMKGYLAYDENIEGKRPGVLVVHEFWGLNNHARNRARMLAEMGYSVLVVDMYGDGKLSFDFEVANKLQAEIRKNPDVAKARFMAAMNFLKRHPTVDPIRIAGIGFCFGGEVLLDIARQGVDINGVVCLHGGLTTMVKPAQRSDIKAKILVLNGADDPFIPPKDVEAFKEEMKSAGANYQYVNYPGAVHTFTNPDADYWAKKMKTLAVGYNAKVDKESWEEIKSFLIWVLH